MKTYNQRKESKNIQIGWKITERDTGIKIKKSSTLFFWSFTKTNFNLNNKEGIIFNNSRTEKIFKVMSNIIQTRTPDQCRSHHQKM